MTASILESITRATIIGWPRNILNIEVVERDIDRTELYIAEEVFMCGTAVEILPVFSVDKLDIGDDGKGKITSAIRRGYILK